MQLFIDDEIFHKQRRGGVARYLCEMAQAAVRQDGVQVVLFGGWCRNLVIREVAPAPRLRVVCQPRDTKLRISGVAWALSTWWRRRSFAAALRADPDTIYHPGLYAYDRWIARRAAGLVATVYDMQLEIQGTISKSTRRQVEEKRAIAGMADHLFCISQSTQRDLERLVPPAIGKTSVVHPGTSLIAPPPRTAPAEPRYFLMVGGRHGHKNGRLACESFAAVARHHPDVRLKMCGGTAPGTEGELDFSGADAVRNRIDWIQPDDRGLAEAYAGALALLYPSDYEGFGLPVLEAMLCGCPVITSAVSSLPEVGGDAALYIVPGDGRALTEHLQHLLTDEALRRDRIARGREQAARFSWNRTAAGVVKACRAILARRRG